MESEVLVDCRGVKIPQETLDCHIAGRKWRFLLADSLKKGRRFHLGLFINQAALSDAVLHYPRERRACALFESPINDCYQDVEELIRRFPVICTHQQNLLDRGEPFIPLMFGTNWIGVSDEHDTERVFNNHPQKTKLASFIGSLAHPNDGAYGFRRQVAECVLSREDVDGFGKGIREIPGKREAIAPYCFSIAMENAASDYYFSEKLIDCILLETVPIYYGCPGIGHLLDQRGLLCFNTLEELRDVLDRLTARLYDKMRPFVLENKWKVIREGWHGHPSLFHRLAEMLPESFDLTSEYSFAVNTDTAWKRRLWARLTGL